MLVVAVPGFVRQEETIEELEETQQALADFVVASAEASCQQRRDFRDVLVDLVELSDDGTGLNLSGIPSFAAMPESVKEWVRELERRSSSSDEPSAFVEDALELLETVKCPDPTDLPIQEASP